MIPMRGMRDAYVAVEVGGSAVEDVVVEEVAFGEAGDHVEVIVAARHLVDVVGDGASAVEGEFVERFLEVEKRVNKSKYERHYEK